MLEFVVLLHGNDDFAARVTLFQIPNCRLRLTNFVGAIDHGRDFSSLHQLAQSIQIFRWDAGTALSAAVQVTAVTLPNDIQFQTLAGLPNGAATVPDGFGNATVAIDLDQGVAGGGIKNQVMFMPDGSAHDVNGSLNSGILYVARNGDLYSSRAVTLYGATGRIRGWRLLNSGGAKWFQQ